MGWATIRLKARIRGNGRAGKDYKIAGCRQMSAEASVYAKDTDSLG
jgi:hypothetical protein